jgi:tetratricopeptide (TPR) repeat protein
LTRRPSPSGAGSASNDVSGIVLGPSVQALDIHGGVHFHGANPPPAVVPRQAAAAHPHFTGRLAELEALRQAAASSAPTMVVLSGPAGVGKTALARQWAHHAAEEFPDGQLHFDLSGFGSGPPADPAEALRSFLGALGVPAVTLPVSLAELTALYRSHTADRSLMVVLDDAFSAAQVRVLVPASSSSMTVVTSRSRLSGLVADGATLLEIAPLTAADSLALLTNLVGQTRIDNEREEAVRLAELCAGLPIALCLAAARLSTRPRLTVAAVVVALTDETDRLIWLETPNAEASVRGIFELSYRALAVSEAALYRRLSLHPGQDFGPGLVAALMPLIHTIEPTERAGRLIDVLLEANLLQEIAEDKFQYHSLVRLHARHKADADDTEAVRDSATLAMLEWYLRAASEADIAVTPYRRRLTYDYCTTPGELPAFTDREQALAWLDRERSNLGAAGRAALKHRWAELAWHLSDVLWPLQLYRKSGDRKDIDVRGLDAARMWGDPRAEGRMLKRLGRTCTTLGDYDLAEQYLRTAVARCTRAGDAEGRVEAEEMLALSYRDSGREDEAVAMLREVLSVRRSLGNNRDVGLTLINLGTLLAQLRQVAAAIEFLREAGGLLDQSVAVDPYNPVRVKTGLARAYLEAGDLLSADRFAVEAVKGMRALGVAMEEAEAWELSGLIAERRGDLDRSRRCLQLALEILETHRSPRAVGLRRRMAELPPRATPPGVQEIC